MTDSERVRRERDFFQRLLELGDQPEIEPFLEDALALILEISGANQAYLSLETAGDGEPSQQWWIAKSCTEAQVADIRAVVSSGIIAEALAAGRTIHTPSALLDPRFDQRTSVRSNKIEAVLCAPVGDPPIGVVYLQGRGSGGPFDKEVQRFAELFARHLAPLADRLLARRLAREASDATRATRATLRAEELVGRSAALAEVLRQIALVAPLEIHALLTGPSGTGKTAVAGVIAKNGPRAAGPFVELNCATIPEPLLESELFGALPGAHSTATRRLDGKLKAAEGGTLLLDEVGELSFSAQAKLLQFLQSRTYYPLGATSPEVANVRIIAATNTDLGEAVKERRFREDLYYRLQVMPIRLPTLAERTEDIPLLVQYFAKEARSRHNFAQIRPSLSALRAAQSAEWPGNVRQLANFVEAAVIRAAGQGLPEFGAHHLFPDSQTHRQAEEQLSFQEATHRFQRGLIEETLSRTNWSVAEAARRMDMARSHLYNLIKVMAIQRPL